MLKIFLKRKKDVDAKGLYNEKTGEVTVLKGSRVSYKISESPTFKGVKMVRDKRRDSLSGNVVIKDISFSSCSSAANYVTGGSTNGFLAWKDGSGKSLRELLK